MTKYMTTTERMVAIAIIIAAALFTLHAFTGFTPKAMAAKPPSPPGQGECEHGNSNKPCKDDPQPEHGKDCEEHGPKNGGVNEDHCKGEDNPPVLVEVCRNGDPHVMVLAPAQGDGTCDKKDPPVETTPDETTPEETTPGETVPPPSTVPADESSATPPAVQTTDLEEQLEEQAKANGANNAPSGHAAAADELPYTGVDLKWVALLGATLVAAGLYLRRRFGALRNR
jgi:LPXTG-motif cell wall-anchored protein